MNIYVLHDNDDAIIRELFNNNNEIIFVNTKKAYAKCKGCFKCWLKTPGLCTMKDGMQDLGINLLTCDRIIIISELLYGGFSVNIKRLWDRCIPGVLPFFKKKNKELHHAGRYKNNPEFKIFFYNTKEMIKKEEELARNLIKANAINFMSEKHSVDFIDDIKELEGISI